MATLLSVNVGLPAEVPWQGRTVYTGVWKRSVSGPQMVRRLNIDGDGQGDLAGHGGEQRAVLVYQIDSYRHWQEHFGRSDFEYGQFGENLTVDGLPDDEVCIGDRYRIGEAEVEVTQPRVTCFRVGMRLGEPQLPALLVSHHRPGFYARVITEGHVQAGDDIVRTRVGPHAISVAAVDALLYLPGRDADLLRAVLDVPALSPGWQQSFRELLDAESSAPDGGPVVGPPPGWPGFRPLRVTEVVAETPTITSVYLAAEDGAPLPRPVAGQYLTLRLAGAGEPAPVRSYSLSSSPDAARYRISVKREGLGSTFVATGLHTGSVVEVAAPRGEFRLDEGTEPLLLVSAGIGVTPVLAMLHRLVDAASTREVWWIHVARDAVEHAFAAEAHALLQALPAAHEHVFYTRPGIVAPVGVLLGRPSAATLRRLGLPVSAAVAYLCGPAAFMNDVGAALQELGLPADRIRTELFGARPSLNPGIVHTPSVPPHQPAGRPGTGPLITFARSGLSTRWPEGSGTLLELAEACDVPTRWSCRTGVCHNCSTPVLAGDVDYAPDPLEMPPPGEALLCCSRPRADVVLDL
jgi:ferredoxin-NADP reductase/MOSC domain-containing protein YiiM